MRYAMTMKKDRKHKTDNINNYSRIVTPAQLTRNDKMISKYWSLLASKKKMEYITGDYYLRQSLSTATMEHKHR